MKLLSLNIWAGREFDSLREYLSNQSNDTDIFCFQEVFDTPTSERSINEHYRANIFSELQKVLPDHEGHFAPCQEGYGMTGVDFPVSWGLAMFTKKELTVDETGGIYLFGEFNSRGQPKELGGTETMPRNLQYAKIRSNGESYTISHFHGVWDGKTKNDTEARIEQSKRVINLLGKFSDKKILCGDFNLLPDTRSIAMLEETDLTNLIKTHDIKTTRSSLYTKPEKFADYTFVSPDINVHSFEVPQVEVSDHLPMILHFS